MVTPLRKDWFWKIHKYLGYRVVEDDEQLRALNRCIRSIVQSERQRRKKVTTKQAAFMLLADRKFVYNLAEYINGIGGIGEYMRYVRKAIRSAADIDEEPEVKEVKHRRKGRKRKIFRMP